MKKFLYPVLYIILGILILFKVIDTLVTLFPDPKFASACKQLHGTEFTWEKVQALKGYVLRENNGNYFMTRMDGHYTSTYYAGHDKCKKLISDTTKFQECFKSMRIEDKPVITAPNEIRVHQEKYFKGNWACLIKIEGDKMETSMYRTAD